MSDFVRLVINGIYLLIWGNGKHFLSIEMNLSILYLDLFRPDILEFFVMLHRIGRFCGAIYWNVCDKVMKSKNRKYLRK
jgi:hypothetical protein